MDIDIERSVRNNPQLVIDAMSKNAMSKAAGVSDVSDVMYQIIEKLNQPFLSSGFRLSEINSILQFYVERAEDKMIKQRRDYPPYQEEDDLEYARRVA